MAVARPVRDEQHDAVAGAAIGIVEPPLLRRIEPDQCLDPAFAVEIGPLIGEAQMDLDDASADGFEIDHAGVAREMTAAPRAAPVLDRGHGVRVHFPVIEGAVAAGLAAGMSPPVRYAVDDGDVAADVIAFQQRAPHMTGLVGRDVVGLGSQSAAADAHALEIVDRLGEDRIGGGAYAMRRGIEALARRHRELVVDPAVRRIPESRRRCPQSE